MTSITRSYVNVLTLLVEYFHGNSKSVNPISINKAKFYARALSIAFWYVNRPELTIGQIGMVLKERFGESNLLSYLIDNASPELLDLFDSVKKPTRYGDLSTIYEGLLSIETSGFEIIPGKEYRNKLGSYYTPQDFAEEITRLTFEQFLKNNSTNALKDAKIVDFSCGCGAFLLAALKNYLNIGFDKEELKEIIHNIYACDVDPLALEIANISVFVFCDAP